VNKTEKISGNYITLHCIRKLFSGLSKSNFKDHYGDVVITQWKYDDDNDDDYDDGCSASRTVTMWRRATAEERAMLRHTITLASIQSASQPT